MSDNIAETINNAPIDLVNIDSLSKVSKAKISFDFKFFHNEKIKIKPPEIPEAINNKIVWILCITDSNLKTQKYIKLFKK